MYKLSKRSLSRLEGVNEQLVEVVKYAITITDVDFGVTQGLRTHEQQVELVKRGASQTMRSKHLVGEAVDVVAYMGSRISWELPLYFEIADAFFESAFQTGVEIRWGAAWHQSIKQWPGVYRNSEQLHREYVDTRKRQGRKAFIDAPHFEIVT